MNTISDNIYLIQEKCVLDIFLPFYNILFNTNIRSAFNIYWPDILYWKKILLPWYLIIEIGFVDYYKLDLPFLYLT